MAVSVLSTARKLAAHHGGKCLSTAYHKGAELAWRCANDHEWRAHLNVVGEGAWCYRCAMRSGRPAILKHLKAVAAARGGKCLSQAYAVDSAPLKWECVHGHRWEAVPGPIKNRGVWCPHCARKAPLSIEEMQRTAAERGGKCLSQAYKGNHVKLRWQCENGHVWEAEPAHIRSGKWCPHHDCRYGKVSEKLRGDIEELRAIARIRGGELLSRSYTNRNDPLKWRCREGHTWSANASNVKFGATWCPKCPRTYGAKVEFKKMIKKIKEARASS